MPLWTAEFRLNTLNIGMLWHKTIHWLICESTCRALFSDYFWSANQFASTVSTCYKKSVLFAERHWRWQEPRWSCQRTTLSASCRKALRRIGTARAWLEMGMIVLRLDAEKLLLTCEALLWDEPKFGNSVRIPSGNRRSNSTQWTVIESVMSQKFCFRALGIWFTHWVIVSN